MSAERYLIIGFGVYGISAALHLLEAKPAQLTILSHHQPQEPSDDISKIVRIDYTRVSRMKEAICAQECWRNDKRFTPFYQPVGRIVAYDNKDISTLNNINNARSELGKEKRNHLGKDILENVFGSTNAPDGLTFVYNKDDGLVEWKGCMQAMRDIIQNKKATIREIPVQKLIHNGERITAVSLVNNERIETEDMKIILAAGPWIMEILERSGIEQPPDSRAPVATGIFAFILQLSDDQRKVFQGKPGFSHIGHGMSKSA